MHSYIFHACSTFALENIRKGKGKHKHICFFLIFSFFPLGGALSPDTANVVWLVRPAVGSAPCWPRTVWAMRLVNFLGFGLDLDRGGGDSYPHPCSPTCIVGWKLPLGIGIAPWRGRRLCMPLMHTTGIEYSSYSVHHLTLVCCPHYCTSLS